MNKQLVLAAALTLATTACATHNIHYKNPTVTASAETKSAKQSFFLYGMAGGSEVDLAKLCPSGVAGIDSKKSVADQLLTTFTLGLYSPMSVDVTCAAGTMTAGGAQ
jgi:hypothetical protein